MSFLKPAAQAGTFGLAGLALSDKKKPKPAIVPQNRQTLIGATTPKNSLIY